MAAALVATTVLWLALEAASSVTEPEARWSRDHASAIATGLSLFAVHVTALVEHALRSTAGSFVGLALIAVGVALRIAAIHSLGADFVSTRAAPSRVVSTGLYRWLRHPSELGLVVAAAGAAVLLGSLCAAAVTIVVLVPLSLHRCAGEDRVLQAMRGQAATSRVIQQPDAIAAVCGNET